jgi:MarR family transcriptional regulator, lower aerobic nicotinate degradation pathway regulator
MTSSSGSADLARAPAASEMTDSLVRVSFTVTALLSRVAAEHDLSLTQLRVLAILRDHEPTMAELASYLGLERSSVSGLIDRAVKRGLVRRDPSSDDGRAVRLSLTQGGQHLASLGAEEVAALMAPMTTGLTPADQKRLGILLDRMLLAAGLGAAGPVSRTESASGRGRRAGRA